MYSGPSQAISPDDIALKAAKDHIESLNKNNSKKTDATNYLKSAIKETLSSGNFVLELLQNADDAADDNIQATFTTMPTSCGTYLIFSHNGKPFTQQNVEEICTYAQSKHHNKRRTKDKIGYKGIGFKTIFNVANWACIISNNYRFHFAEPDIADCYVLPAEECYISEAPVEPAPWPIVPIWTELETLPKEIREKIIFSENKTFIILRINHEHPQDYVTTKLDKLKTDPSALLFLRHLKTLSIDDYKIEIKENAPNIKELISGDTCLQRWLLHTTDIRGEQLVKVQKQQKSLGDKSSCPERLKTAKSITITLAAAIGESTDEHQPHLEHVKNPVLFAGLPTEINCKLPYLVNADFLLDTARTTLLPDNSWNTFLFENIAYQQFIWLHNIATSDYKKHFLHLVCREIKVAAAIQAKHSQYTQAFKTAAQRAIQEIPFIPEAPIPGAPATAKLLFCQEAIVDPFDFFSTMELKYDRVKDNKKLVTPFLDREDKEILITTLAVQSIPEELLFKYIEQFANQDKIIEFQKRLLGFLKIALGSNQLSKDKLLSSNIAFLLTDEGSIAAPQQLYIRSSEDFWLPAELEIAFIHNDLLISHPNCLTNLGILEATQKNISSYVIQLLSQNQHEMEPKKHLAIVAFILKAYMEELLEEDDIITIRKNLLLLTNKKDLQHATDLYLPREYHPKFQFENYCKENDTFLNASYITYFTGNQTTTQPAESSWTNFFIKLGVRQHEPKIQQTDKYKCLPNTHNHDQASLIEYSQATGGWKKFTKYHFFGDFIDFPLTLLQLLCSKEEISKIFWPKFIEQWHIIEHCKPTLCNRKESKDLTHSFLQFHLRKVIETASCYAPRLSPLASFINNLHFGTVMLMPTDIILTTEQEKYCGFKTELKITECLSILDELRKTIGNEDTSEYLRAYTLVLEQLLNSESDEAANIQIQTWAETGYLPAQNNTLQPIRKLSYFHLPGVTAPKIKRNWLIPLQNINKEKLRRLGSLFATKVIDHNSIQLHDSFIPKQDPLLRDKITKLLPAIALIETRASRKNVEFVYRSLNQKFKDLQIFSLKSLWLIITDGSAETFQTSSCCLQNNLYYAGNLNEHHHALAFCKQLTEYFNLSSQVEHVLTNLFLADPVDRFIQNENFDADAMQLYHALTLSLTDNLTSLSPMPAESSTVASKVPSEQPSSKVSISPPKPSHKTGTPQSVSSSPEAAAKAVPITTAKLIDIPHKHVKTVGKDIHSKDQDVDMQETESSTKAPEIGCEDEEQEYKNPANSSRIGRKGEELVYNSLKEHYIGKYSGTPQEDDCGFQLSGIHNKNKTNDTITVIWHNKTTESFQPHDFSIWKQTDKQQTITTITPDICLSTLINTSEILPQSGLKHGRENNDQEIPNAKIPRTEYPSAEEETKPCNIPPISATTEPEKAVCYLKKVIEVKSTANPNTPGNQHFLLSKHEFKEQQKHKENYRFFRVYGVWTPNPEIKKFSKEDIDKIKIEEFKVEITKYQVSFKME